MKRSFSVWVAAIAIALAAVGIAAAQLQNQSLGDYARAAKKAKAAPDAKTAPRVYDNDNLPSKTSISVVGDSASGATADGQNAADDKAAKDKPGDQAGEKKTPQLATGQSSAEREQALDAWKQKLADQKEKVSLLSREVDVLQREHQLKASEFWGNSAQRAQNPNGFADEDKKDQEKIAEKQKQLDEAKAKLSDMQDQARKEGAPNSVTEQN